jgi:hypothetical protein
LALGLLIERFLAAPEGEIASPAVDEYQRFSARAIALVMDLQAVKSCDVRYVTIRRSCSVGATCEARATECQESPPGDGRLHCWS